MELYETKSTSTIVTPKSDQVLCIDKASYAISFSSKAHFSIPERSSPKKFIGILGLMKSKNGCFLIVVSKAEQIGQIAGSAIKKMVSYEIIEIGGSQSDTYKNSLELTKFILDMPSFYFSDDFDITRCRQSLDSQKDKFSFETTDERFFFNYHICEPIMKVVVEHPSKTSLHCFVLPMIMGLAEKVSFTVKNTKKTFDIWLISRRNRHRAGTRLNTRGIDKSGHVANFVETEQLLVFEDKIASYVEIRGSIPLFWSQYPNLKYKPIPKLTESHEESFLACTKHFEEQQEFYQNVTCVSLVDQKGVELKISQEFESLIKELNSEHVKFVGFDFHKMCAKGKTENLSILLEQCKDDVNNFNFFLANQSKQQGVFRVNCFDNLDRTNVVQNLFALESFLKQVEILGICKADEIKKDGDFSFLFRNLWADNGNAISMQYTGTNALKNDITRTGKRTINGMIDDGTSSLKRYYLNNFVDGDRQDAFSHFTGVNGFDLEKTSEKLKPKTIVNGLILAFFAMLFCFTKVLISMGVGIVLAFVLSLLLATMLIGLVVYKIGKEMLISLPSEQKISENTNSHSKKNE